MLGYIGYLGIATKLLRSKVAKLIVAIWGHFGDTKAALTKKYMIQYFPNVNKEAESIRVRYWNAFCLLVDIRAISKLKPPPNSGILVRTPITVEASWSVGEPYWIWNESWQWYLKSCRLCLRSCSWYLKSSRLYLKSSRGYLKACWLYF